MFIGKNKANFLFHRGARRERRGKRIWFMENQRNIISAFPAIPAVMKKTKPIPGLSCSGLLRPDERPEILYPKQRKDYAKQTQFADCSRHMIRNWWGKPPPYESVFIRIALKKQSQSIRSRPSPSLRDEAATRTVKTNPISAIPANSAVNARQRQFPPKVVEPKSSML